MATPLPKVRASGMLQAWAKRNNEDIDVLIEEFAHWKAMPDANWSWYFGRDGFYSRPTRNGKLVLRHVHMPPAATSPKFAAWDAAYRRVVEKKPGTTEKTSDTILIYADAKNARHGFLLLHIVREPDGHTFADMKTPQDRTLMKLFADAADAFLFDGTILEAVNK